MAIANASFASSSLVLFAAHLPIIGIVPAIAGDWHCRRGVDLSSTSDTTLAWIGLKNRYKIAWVTQFLLTAALLVAGVALKILKRQVLVSALIFCMGAAYSLYGYFQNKKVIQALKAWDEATATGAKISIDPGINFTVY